MSNLPQEQQKKEIEIVDGDIKVRSLEDLHRFSKSLFMSGMLPKSYDTPEKVMAGIQFAKELNLPPLNALKNIAIVNGSPSIFGDLPLAIVTASGKLEKIDEFSIDKEYQKICYENKNLGAKIFASVCIIKRKGGEEKSFSYTIMDADSNPNSRNQVWKSYFPVMMKRKARSLALKDIFPDVLFGAAIAEYDHDVIPVSAEVIDTTSIKERPKRAIEQNTQNLNDKFLK